VKTGMRRKSYPTIFVLLCLCLVAIVRAQADNQFGLSEPDISEFPLVRLNLQTADPLTESQLAALSLRENGVPISEYDLRFVPVGGDVIFVLDADTTMSFVDDESELTRLEKVQESISRYAARFMNPTGLDRVSVIVPDATNEGAAFLVADATTADVVATAVQAYAPALPETAPIQAMLAAAIEHAAAIRQSGRFQAILLFSEGRRLGQFLTYAPLVEGAQAIDLPVYVAIVGAQASFDEIENAAGLYEPTGGFYVHMPVAAESDPVYLLWQRLGNQAQITYRSLQRESGRYPINVNIGQRIAATELVLTIEPPQVQLQFDDRVIRRAGTAVDTPLTELQPTIQPLPVLLTWPDNMPRDLTAVTLLVNNTPQPLLDSPAADENGILTIEWNVRQADIGAYELQVQIEDELGYTAETTPIIITVAVERPLPPTPTPAPTATPMPTETLVGLSQLPRTDLLLALAGFSLVGIFLFLIRWWRRYRERMAFSEWRAQRRAELQTAIKPDPLPAVEVPMKVALELLDDAPGNVTHIDIEGDNVTLGRDHEIAQIVFSDRSVARLHARIRQRNGRYWLYDEGSASGTFLNHERVGLSPQLLQDKDEIRLGHVSLRVHLQPVGEQ
jgi:hypothetical protein